MPSAVRDIEDGLWKFSGPGRKSRYIFIQDGALWLDIADKHPLLILTSGKSLRVVSAGKKKIAVMRASDWIGTFPDDASWVSDYASRHGLKL